MGVILPSANPVLVARDQANLESAGQLETGFVSLLSLQRPLLIHRQSRRAPGGLRVDVSTLMQVSAIRHPWPHLGSILHLQSGAHQCAGCVQLSSSDHGCTSGARGHRALLFAL